MYRLNISYKQFYITLNEMWLYESDPNAPSTSSEPGGKQWQHSIQGWRNFTQASLRSSMETDLSRNSWIKICFIYGDIIPVVGTTYQAMLELWSRSRLHLFELMFLENTSRDLFEEGLGHSWEILTSVLGFRHLHACFDACLHMWTSIVGSVIWFHPLHSCSDACLHISTSI